MNYAQLKMAIRAYTENDFPATVGAGGMTSDEQIAMFIRQAELRVFNGVQLLDLRKNSTGNTTPEGPYITVPCDWLATFSLAVIDPFTGAYEYLLNKDVNFIRQAFPRPTDFGTPTHYAFFDKDSFLLAPTPDKNYLVELHYFYYPDSITITADGRSWLGDKFEDVLLYGSLIEAGSFMKSEADVMADYQKRYDEAFAQLKILGEGKNRQDNYRVPQTRLPVQ